MRFINCLRIGKFNKIIKIRLGMSFKKNGYFAKKENMSSIKHIFLILSIDFLFRRFFKILGDEWMYKNSYTDIRLIVL